MNKLPALIAILLCLGLLSLPALAETLPDYYPESFDRWGVINRIDTDNNVLVIDDSTVPFSTGLRVYTPTTRFGTVQSLQPGMRIGFGTSGSRAVGGTVSEVWVLPDDYTPGHPVQH